MPYDQAIWTRRIGLEPTSADVVIDPPHQSCRSAMEFHAELLRLGAVQGL